MYVGFLLHSPRIAHSSHFEWLSSRVQLVWHCGNIKIWTQLSETDHKDVYYSQIATHVMIHVLWISFTFTGSTERKKLAPRPTDDWMHHSTLWPFLIDERCDCETWNEYFSRTYPASAQAIHFEWESVIIEDRRQNASKCQCACNFSNTGPKET